MNVLIADDDPFFQKLLNKSLTGWGYETLTAGDGQEAWAIVSSSASPRIAVLDYMMPNMDGLEVCHQIRAAGFPHYVYIILLTARGKREDVAAGLKAGADDY